MSIHPRHVLPMTRGTCAAFLVTVVVVAAPRIAAGQTDDKVTICHRPPGNPGANAHEIVVALAALPAHLDHSDTLGPCTCASTQGTPCGSGLPPCCAPLVCTPDITGFRSCDVPASGAMPLGGACTSDAQCGLNQCVFLGPDDGVCGG